MKHTIPPTHLDIHKKCAHPINQIYRRNVSTRQTPLLYVSVCGNSFGSLSLHLNA